MTHQTSAERCTQPGCTGLIEDGYCNVCGSPAGGAPIAPGPALPRGVRLPRPGAPGAPGGAPAAVSASSQRLSARTSSRLASAAIGSARTGSRSTRRVGTVSTRLRTHRIGAGITTVPPAPVADPLSAVLTDPQVAENKRVCPVCGQPVGRTRDGVPGRTQGFCPHCGARFDFTPQLLPGDVVGGQYEVVGALAHGGLGWVYLARDQNVSGRFVVLKGLLNSGDRDAYEAAIAEREFLAEVEHPLIVEIYNFVMHGPPGREAGYTVMEYVGGISLKELLKDRQARTGAIDPLPVDQALAYVLEILPAFSYLHDRGLLYCDFKPDNVIQQGDGLKLIDLGGVRRIGDDTSAIFGTVGYQAPEVPTEGTSIASDIYTIGRTLATLVLDFRGNTTTYVAALPPVEDTEVFQRFDSFYRLLAKACALDPSDRFASADELRSQALGVLREVVAAGAEPGSAPLPSALSPHFEPPTSDGVDAPLRWDELPKLRVDPADPMATWLAGITDPVGKVQVLRGAAQVTREVELARIRAAIEAGLDREVQPQIQAVLDKDPWEWRALWLQGLHELATGRTVAARSSFNAVYGQVPGELAPKLALAVTCEASDEPDVAEQLYLVCGRTDATYTAASAFGLARIRAGRRDPEGTLAALDLVPRTRGSYPVARARRAGVLVNTTASRYAGLAEALASIEGVQLDPALRCDLEIATYGSALTRVLARVRDGVPINGVPPQEVPLRLALERAYRERARYARTSDERIDLVDRANAVRPRTLI